MKPSKKNKTIFISRILLVLLAFASFNSSLHHALHQHVDEGQEQIALSDDSSAHVQHAEENKAVDCTICDLINTHQQHEFITSNAGDFLAESVKDAALKTADYSYLISTNLNNRGPPSIDL